MTFATQAGLSENQLASPSAASIASDGALKACGRFSVSVTTPRSSRCCSSGSSIALTSLEEARVLGLVNRVAAPEALDDEVEALVASIVAKPGVAVAMGKALFYRHIEVGIESAYEDAGAAMACNMMDPSALESVQAFIEKRPPSWFAAQASTTLGRGAPTVAKRLMWTALPAPLGGEPVGLDNRRDDIPILRGHQLVWLHDSYRGNSSAQGSLPGACLIGGRKHIAEPP